MRSVEDLKQGKPPVGKIIRIGMDTSKSVFQLHGVDEAGEVALRRKLTRKAMVAFFASLPSTVIAIEACGSAHHWARVLTGMGHEVRLLPPQHVKPLVMRNKNDAADAAALCEALGRPKLKIVPAKSATQQADQMLIGTRERLIRGRTRLMNTIRGHAAEFGLVAAKGIKHIEPLLARIAADETLPATARDLFAMHAAELRRLQVDLAKVEAIVMKLHKSNEISRRLAHIPAVGPIGATMMAVEVNDAHRFKSGRDFAAWIGLTPKDHSTAGKQRLGGITRAGNERLRSTLVVGATAVIQQIKRGRRPASPWLVELLRRKPAKLAAVALANKTARIAWKLMVSGEAYNPNRGVLAMPLAA
jgi:transposase